MEAVAELESKVEVRKRKALELKIDEKARKIVRVLGSHYYHSHVGGGGGLSDPMVFSEDGHAFENNNLRIEAGKEGLDGEKKDFVYIYLFKNLLSRVLRRYWEHEVYSKEGSEIAIFKKEDKWLGFLNNLYIRAEKVKQQKELQEKEKIDGNKIELLENFGL